MVDLSVTAILSFALTSLLIELTPGPNMTYLAMVAAQSGRRAGFSAAVGAALGLTALSIAAALGLSALLAASPAMYAALRWGGVGYLLYLAWDAWRDGTRPAEGTPQSHTRFFGRGLVTNLLNPKALVFYVAVLPTFIDPAGQLLQQSLVLSAVYVLVASAVHVAIVALAGGVQPMLANKQLRRVSGALFAAGLVGVAIWFAWSTR